MVITATLYEIEQAILDCLDGETGEIIDVERLNELQIARDKKIENCALWYKNVLSDAEQYKKEKEVFAEKERIAKNKAESLKRYISGALNGSTFKTSKVDIKYRKSEVVVIDEENCIDSQFLKYVEPSIDKLEIKRAIKEGQDVAGAHIEVRENIQIK